MIIYTPFIYVLRYPVILYEVLLVDSKILLNSSSATYYD